MCSRETESYMRPRRFNPLAISKFKEALKAFYNLDASGAAPADWCLHQVGVAWRVHSRCIVPIHLPIAKRGDSSTPAA